MEDAAHPEPDSPDTAVRRSRKSVFGAAMLGAGTILQPKVDPEEHWSESPKIVLVVEDAVSGDDSPISVDFDSVPAGPALRPRPRPRRRWFRRR